ncbi:RND efflux system, outer membrane lipoprotein, NodT [Polaribacter irgensii 23-P]|uniref:RND efflux system, outer membrane lipoprotein, NodT n=1 Tax=Polaribacter irgensii 23-P TaxID=313594 RepID=A4BY57_9FLAO|nr:TolC family protein [Polaribacter irgensii]EAR13898.1 RND efflux system, outer membrane lipoprotein, NodT [Polaribacter irgensii 23-P]
MNKSLKILNTRKYSVLFVSILTILYSCVPGKAIIRAESKIVPEQYKGQIIDTVNDVTVKWKDFFKDSNLEGLIHTALTNNQELNIMLQHMNIAQNEIQAKKGEYVPYVNIYLGAEVEKVGEYTRNGAIEKNLNIREGRAFPEPLKNFTGGLSASWEIDIWKKLRNGKKAAVLEYLASVEGIQFMKTQLIAEIASVYYELITLDNQLEIIDQNLSIQQNALRMVKLQKEAARTTQLAVRRFEAEVLKNQSNKYQVRQKIVENENKINFLVGRYPQAVLRNSNDFITKAIDSVAAGIPLQLLENRPDIRRAELELSASKLNVKIAKANFYPTIDIKANMGLEAFKTTFLKNTPESLLYALAGDVVSPLINRNGIKAAYKNANSKQLQAVFEYEKTILTAYLEVSNQLSNIKNLQKSFELKEKQVQALKESIDLSIQLFKSAKAEYTEVLLTQREVLDARLEIIETKRDQLLANVKLYQSLGGGWR